jgi:hypothetical protein
MLQKIEQLLEKQDITVQKFEYFNHLEGDPNCPKGISRLPDRIDYHAGYVYYSKTFFDMHLRWMIYHSEDDIRPGDWNFEFSLVFIDDEAYRSFNIGLDFNTESWEISYLDEFPEEYVGTTSAVGDAFAKKFHLNINDQKHVLRVQAMQLIEDIISDFRRHILQAQV